MKVAPFNTQELRLRTVVNFIGDQVHETERSGAKAERQTKAEQQPDEHPPQIRHDQFLGSSQLPFTRL